MTNKEDLLNELGKNIRIRNSQKNKVKTSLASTKTIKKYEKTLNRIEKLEKKLKKLKRYDKLFNSEYLWTRSVNNTIKKLDKIVNRIDGEIYLANKIMLDMLDGDPSYSYSIFSYYY